MRPRLAFGLVYQTCNFYVGSFNFDKRFDSFNFLIVFGDRLKVFILAIYSSVLKIVRLII